MGMGAIPIPYNLPRNLDWRYNMDEFWKEYTPQLSKAMKAIEDNGVSVQSREQLKRIANPIIREAKRRMRELEKAGLTDSPAYRYIKRNKIDLTAAGTNLNLIRRNVMQAYNFITRKTSTVKGATDFLESTTNKWAGMSTTREQREAIWDLFSRLEDRHAGHFDKEVYSSGELSADIYVMSEVLRAKKWDIDEAYNILSKDTEILLDKDLNYDTMELVTDWYTRIR